MFSWVDIFEGMDSRNFGVGEGLSTILLDLYVNVDEIYVCSFVCKGTYYFSDYSETLVFANNDALLSSSYIVRDKSGNLLFDDDW